MELGLFFEFYLRPEATHGEAFEEAFSQIEMADRLGLDSIWLAEHHFSPGRSVLSSPLMIANAVANRTRNVRVGTAVEVLPLGNPIRLAEEVATLDHLSGGRFEFGIGRSGSPTGYVGYNIPYAESRARFYETLEVIRRAWTQESFSYKGRFLPLRQRLRGAQAPAGPPPAHQERRHLRRDLLHFRQDGDAHLHWRAGAIRPSA